MIAIEAFISGDTRELGLSLVSLEKPTKCLVHHSTQKIAHRVRKQMNDTGCYIKGNHGALEDEYLIVSDQANCPY